MGTFQISWRRDGKVPELFSRGNREFCITLCSNVSGHTRLWLTGSHLRGAPLAPVSLSLPPLVPLRHAGDGLCLVLPPRNVRWLSSSNERATFISNQRRRQDGYQETTIQAARQHTTMWQHQSDDLGKPQREGRNQSGEWRNGTSFGLNDLEALLTVAREAKEWISAHVLRR